MSNRTYFEAARFIKSKETESSIEQDVDRALYKKPEFTLYDEVVLKSLSLRGRRSRNKVSVGEPAEGSLTLIQSTQPSL